MGFEVDWRHGAEHTWTVHQLTAEEANEALADDGLIFVHPDPKSRSGQSARTIGYSPTANAVLVVILVHRADAPGRWWGANGWRANSTDQRIYREHNGQEKDDEKGSDE